MTVDTFVTNVRDQIRARTRLEIGDNSTSFAVTTITDGVTTRFDLGVVAVDVGTVSVTINAIGVPSGNYSIITDEGILQFTSPPVQGANLTVTGSAYQFFTNTELDVFIDSALLKHTHDATASYPSIDIHGFKQFSHVPMTLATLPPVEYHLVAILAAVEALWVLEADATYDIDVSTALGTSLPREERLRNIQARIEQLQDRYDTLAKQLNVGISRVEVVKLRRVSRTTGRLIPVYREREYDDNALPPRLLPTIDAAGLPSSNLVPAPDLTLIAVAGDPFSQAISVPMNLAGCTVSARITTGGYTTSYVDMTVNVTATGLSQSNVTLSLPSDVVTTLPQAATWHLVVVDAQGVITIPYAGAFLTERTG